MTNRNYGVFINHPGEVEVEVGSEKVSRVGVSIAGNGLEYYLIHGETPLQVGGYPSTLSGEGAQRGFRFWKDTLELPDVLRWS